MGCLRGRRRDWGRAAQPSHEKCYLQSREKRSYTTDNEQMEVCGSLKLICCWAAELTAAPSLALTAATRIKKRYNHYT